MSPREGQPHDHAYDTETLDEKADRLRREQGRAPEAAELRAAAALLREAASHATPGPWRTHDTWIENGGHTATVLTDRPDINDIELVAWLPTMSTQPWDEARNAWRTAGWMALMGPEVGLALADWLDAAAHAHDSMVRGAASVWPDPHEAKDRDAWVAQQTDQAALTVARTILGEQP